MIDPVIEEFFQKQKINKEEWLVKNAKRARSRAFSTHPSTFSHPDTGVGKKNRRNTTYVTPVKCRSKRAPDGFVRSGNVKTEEFDETLGDAAALKIDSFLKLKMTDGKTILQHIKNETELAKNLLSNQTETYESLRKDFLEIIKPVSKNATSSKIKQVYFPVLEDYHLLSVLINSGLLFEIKKRINDIRFPGEIKDLREKKRKNEPSSVGFSELYNLTTIGYGGAQPQNISALNVKNGGKAHLLLSLPPVLQKRNIRFPRYNFFWQSLYLNEYRDIFHALHTLFKTDYNNIKIREGRDYRVQTLIDLIIDRMWAVRSVCNEQYVSEKCRLPQHQKIWLCDNFFQEREKDEVWLSRLCKEISVWIVRTYERLLGKSAYKLSETEREHFQNIVTKNKEALR